MTSIYIEIFGSNEKPVLASLDDLIKKQMTGFTLSFA